MPFFVHDSLEFHYRDEGAGIPFVFQHGLGNDLSQPFELFRATECIRLLAFDCRGHGATRPLGDIAKLSIESFADDLVAFLNHQEIATADVGGTSMGAAVALNFALRYPERVRRLVLSRPAWLDRADPKNLRVLGTVARLLREQGPDAGRLMFQNTEDYRELVRESPASAESVLGLFGRSNPEETAVVLERIPMSRPCTSLSDLRSIEVPTLVLANRLDPIHPMDYAVQLVASIPRSTLHEVTPRSVSIEQHRAEIHGHLAEFLQPSA